MTDNGTTDKSLESWIWDAACSICGTEVYSGEDFEIVNVTSNLMLRNYGFQCRIL